MDAAVLPLPDRLRRATRAAHARIEANPRLARLLAPDLTRAEYLGLLARLYGHHQPAEAAIAAFAPAMPPALDLPRHLSRTRLLAADLAALGCDPARLARLPRCLVPEFSRVEQAWGMLYVLEGSALGGQVIARHLVRALGLGPGPGVLAVAPPGAAAGWRGFRALLGAQRLDQAAVIAAAEDAFARLDAWMAGTD